MNSNRRQFSRIAYHSPAELITGKRQDKVVVLDISLKGALLRLPTGSLPAIPNENCTLHIPLGDTGAIIRMQGTIAHAEGIYIGLACRNLDLDSATHLRRLLELNLGDSALLDRELSSLVGEG
ncbi:MAG: PilZ domain-containing protein [Zoogloeaceae bacterium]|nr:PilZ domain-containing protein [Zoogloeaceae bacterium]